MKILVQHSCTHYEFHVLNTTDDRKAAEIEARLTHKPCTKCQHERLLNTLQEMENR